MSYGSLARRYSRALLELSKEQGVLAQTQAELESFAGIVLQNHQLKDFLASFEIVAEKKHKVIEALAAHIQLSPLLMNFLLLLAQKDRLAALADIAREFTRLVDMELGQTRATLVSATPTSVEVTESVRRALEAKSKKTVLLNSEIDPEILGGLLLKMEGGLWDASIKGALRRMKEQMLS